MRGSKSRLLPLTAVALVAGCAAAPAADDPQEVAQEVVQSLESAVNARDWPAFFANFSESADLVVFELPRAEGRSRARSLMEEVWSTAPEDLVADLTLASVRSATPDVLVAEIDARFTGSQPSSDRATAVIVNRGDSWLIEAFRIMQPTGVVAVGGAMPDAVAADPEHYRVEFENSLVRVLRVTYPAGAGSTLHSHPAYCAVFVTPGTFQFTMPDGGITGGDRSEAGNVSCVDGEIHDPENIGRGDTELVLVELKGRGTFAP
jgi:uncharacterized protein (TIGR02246 family)